MLPEGGQDPPLDVEQLVGVAPGPVGGRVSWREHLNNILVKAWSQILER